MDSILNTIKKMLGIDADYTQFDTDIIVHINTVLMALTQMGIGPDTGFSIADETSTWSDFIEDMSKVEGIKTYIYIKVKTVFDPSGSAAVTDALTRRAEELEWRLTNHM